MPQIRSKLLLLVAATLCAAALPAAAEASPVLVFDHGHTHVVSDPLLPPPTPAELNAPPPPPFAHPASTRSSIQRVVNVARARRRISAAQHDSYTKTLNGAVAALRSLGGRCHTQLANVLNTMGMFARSKRLTPTRMPALFLQLRRNTEFWKAHPRVGVGERVRFTGSPIIFQHFPGQGMQIHPLANFGKANGVYSACTGSDYPKEKYCPRHYMGVYLNDLAAIAARRGRGFAAWEYYFWFDGGKPPWISAISQGSAIQAFARGASFLHVKRYMDLARSGARAFAAKPSIGLRVWGIKGGGNEYLAYSFAPAYRVLNQFLQGLIGLYDYSRLSRDPLGWRLFHSGSRAAGRQLHAYDTGHWSLYSYKGPLSSYSYHQLVTEFLARLCQRTHKGIYCRYARRFTRYEHRPPKGVGGPDNGGGGGDHPVGGPRCGSA